MLLSRFRQPCQSLHHLVTRPLLKGDAGWIGSLSSTKSLTTQDAVPPQTYPKMAGTEDWHDHVNVLGSGDKFWFPTFNKRIHAPKLDENGQLVYRPAYVCHMRTMIKYSHKKLWYMTSFIRGLSVEEALKQLIYHKQYMKGALIVQEVLREAQELAVNEQNVEFKTNLWVAESFIEKADKVKTIRRHARARMGLIEHEYQSYFVRLEEGQPPKDYYEWKADKSPSELLENYIAEQRQRQIVFHQ